MGLPGGEGGERPQWWVVGGAAGLRRESRLRASSGWGLLWPGAGAGLLGVDYCGSVCRSRCLLRPACGCLGSGQAGHGHGWRRGCGPLRPSKDPGVLATSPASVSTRHLLCRGQVGSQVI